MKTLPLLGLTLLLAACTAESPAPAPASTPEPENTFTHDSEPDTIPRVTGIGGVFFSTQNPSELNAWYGEHLGLAIDPFGSPFEFRNADRPDEKNYLRWSTMPEGEPYLAAGNYPFMINYRVNNIEGLIRNLEASGVEMLDSLASYDYGKFIHFMDPQGNQVELWEPVDSVLTAMGGETTH